MIASCARLGSVRMVEQTTQITLFDTMRFLVLYPMLFQRGKGSPIRFTVRK